MKYEVRTNHGHTIGLAHDSLDSACAIIFDLKKVYFPGTYFVIRRCDGETLTAEEQKKIDELLQIN